MARLTLSALLGRVVLLGAIGTALWALFLVSLVPGEPLGGLKAPFRDARAVKLAQIALGKRTRVLAGAAGAGDGGAVDDTLAYPATFKIYISPRPSPPPLPDNFDMRNCVCRDDWKALVGTAESLCTCNGKACGNHVNPRVRRDHRRVGAVARVRSDRAGCTCRFLHTDAPSGVKGGAVRRRHCRTFSSLPPPRASLPAQFITEAEGQDVCSVRRHTGYSCTLGCDGDKVSWYGKSCGASGARTGSPGCVVAR